MNKASHLPAVLALVFLVGCAGYHPGVSKPRQMAGVTKLAVPTFKNETLAPRLEVLVTNALIKQLQIHGAYEIVPTSQADAVLKGTITDILSSQYRAERNNTLNTSQLMVSLLVRWKVEGPDGNNLLTGQAQDYSTLVLDPNFQVTKQQALANAAERLSATMAGELTEGW